jgi:hypothetical protein
MAERTFSQKTHLSEEEIATNKNIREATYEQGTNALKDVASALINSPGSYAPMVIQEQIHRRGIHTQL